MRVVFCGSGKFAVPSLRAIAAGGDEIVCVITQPARPAGRGGKVSGKKKPTPVAAAAGELEIPAERIVEQPDINAEQSLTAIRQLEPDTICVVDFGQIVGEDVRRAASWGAFNLHGSLLPALRGAAPVNWAIIRGHKRTGVTTFLLVDRIDAGPIYVQREVEIDPQQTALELRDRLAEVGAEAVCDTLELLSAGRAKGRRQDELLATFAPKLTKADGRIDWTADAETVRNLIHGTWPWPGGQTIFCRKARRAADVQLVIASASAEPSAESNEPGHIDSDFAVATGKGRLRILEIKPAGKKLMSWRDFINGYRVTRGDCFIRSGSVRAGPAGPD
ncbi:MAG: methionyl-tRNA formyltransferase [Planctomycetota bacterium]|nr:methionyl-tRNA formyltransferase [Planctomycetota bacterium]